MMADIGEIHTEQHNMRTAVQHERNKLKVNELM